jgi:hypothetical protein
MGASAASALDLLRTTIIAAISCHRWQLAACAPRRRGAGRRSTQSRSTRIVKRSQTNGLETKKCISACETRLALLLESLLVYRRA